MKINLELEVGMETAVVLHALEMHAEMTKSFGSQDKIYNDVSIRLGKTIQEKVAALTS